MGSGREYSQSLKNSLFIKLYAIVLPLSMHSPDWVGTSCINVLVAWILFFVATYSSGKESIWIGTPFGSCKLSCDSILFLELANAAVHWKCWPYWKTPNTPSTQDANWTYIRRSEDVQDVLWTSYVRSIYVLCLLGNLRYWNTYFSTYLWLILLGLYSFLFRKNVVVL